MEVEMLNRVLEDSRLERRLRADERSRRPEVEFQMQPDGQQALPDAHKARYEEFKTFVARHVEPFAEQWDREQRLPEAILAKLAQRGYLGCSLPAEYGGQGWDTVTFG